MFLEFGGTDDFWTHPERRYEGHLRTLVLMLAAIGLIAAASVVFGQSLFILAVMLIPAALLTAALTWHTRPRRVPDYRDGAGNQRPKRRRLSSSGR
jgi:Flp pilus assembly protein TadB